MTQNGDEKCVWICKQCTLINGIQNEICEACHEQQSFEEDISSK